MITSKLPSCFETFITAIDHDIKSSETKNLPRDNLTISKREALLDLPKKNDTIIPKTDKGGALVIDEANRQLNDNQLDFNPIKLHTEKKIRNKQLEKGKPLGFKSSKLSFRWEN